jgi:polysaccharide biosynthesis/export protein
MLCQIVHRHIVLCTSLCLTLALAGASQGQYALPSAAHGNFQPQQSLQVQSDLRTQTQARLVSQEIPAASATRIENQNGAQTIALPAANWQQFQYEPVQGTQDRCGYSIHNLPTQPQVAAGRCQPHTVGVDCADNCGRAQCWGDLHSYPFQPLAHGEHLGPIRLPSTLDYRIRVGDQIRFLFIDSPARSMESYRLMIGDEVQIESATDAAIRRGDLVLGRGLVIQPDGKITVSLIGQIHAAGLTIPQLRHNLELAYKPYIREPYIDVTPIKTNSLKTSILNSVDARQGAGGQNYIDLVHPDGTVRLPKIGAICVQGMTLDEVKREVNLRYGQIVAGLEIEPVINSEAPHFVFVSGEVASPGRYQLLGPTSVSQAIALAGGSKIGGNLREIVIFRRAEDWRLLATRVDVRGAHLGKVPTPADEIWLRDSDWIIVPQTPIKLFNNFVKQVFTDGAYGVVPFGGISITKFTGSGGFN